MPNEASSQARPGGRSARVRAAVHRAVEELLAEGPVESLTMPAIAARAGVHPTTVYRRWPSIGDLMAEIATSRFSGDLVVPDTGSLEGDLEAWVRVVATDFEDPDTVAVMRAAIGAAGAEGGRACSEDRQTQLAAMLEREAARGGTVPSAEEAADHLLAPLYYRTIFSGQPMQPGWEQGLVAALLRQCSKR